MAETKDRAACWNYRSRHPLVENNLPFRHSVVSAHVRALMNPGTKRVSAASVTTLCTVQPSEGVASSRFLG
jgi:hypothetical protein